MSSSIKAGGIDVTIHVNATDTGCGDPCHPDHACGACEPFWQNMQATGRFAAHVPSTFAGAEPIHKTNLGARKMDYSHNTFRGKRNNGPH